MILGKDFKPSPACIEGFTQGEMQRPRNGNWIMGEFAEVALFAPGKLWSMPVRESSALRYPS